MPVDRPGDTRAKRGARRDDRRRALVRDFDALAEEQEAEYRRLALRLFAGERESIDQLWKRLVAQSGGRLKIDDALANAAIRAVQRGYQPDGLYHKRWLVGYSELIGQTMSVGGRNVAASTGFSFSLSNPRVRDAIEERATELATHVGETSGARVTAVLRDSVESGVPIARISRRIRDEAFNGDVTLARATTIARTEVVGNLNTGEYESALASEVIAEKEWLAQNDDRVRDSHAALNGVRIPLTERFANGLLHPGESGGAPEEVIGCRCTLLMYAA